MKSKFAISTIEGLRLALEGWPGSRDDFWSRYAERIGVSPSWLTKFYYGKCPEPSVTRVERLHLALVDDGFAVPTVALRDCA